VHRRILEIAIYIVVDGALSYLGNRGVKW